MSSQKGKIREWQTILSEYENSSLTVKAYCASKNVSSKSFYYWKGKLKSERDRIEEDKDFNEIFFRSENAKAEVLAGSAMTSTGIHIQIGIAHLNLEKNFDVEEFRKTAEVLMRLSC